MVNCQITSEPLQFSRYHDRYGSYLAMHALMATAGQYLNTCPVVEDDWEGDPWRHWLSGYGLAGRRHWLSDATDPFPADLPSIKIDLSDPHRTATAEEKRNLVSLVDANADGSLPDWFLVGADWKSGDNSYAIMSALVDHKDSRNFVHALYAVEPFFQHIPVVDPEETGNFRSMFAGTIFSWLMNRKQYSNHIDELDPYASPSAYRRYAPTEWCRQAFQLQGERHLGRGWIDGLRVDVFRTQHWGGRFGSGRHASDLVGDRVVVRRESLLAVLRRLKLDLVLLIKANRYIEGGRSGSGKFVYKSVIARVDRHGRVVRSVRISQSVRASLDRLSHRERTNLDDCYQAVLRAEQMT